MTSGLIRISLQSSKSLSVGGTKIQTRNYTTQTTKFATQIINIHRSSRGSWRRYSTGIPQKTTKNLPRSHPQNPHHPSLLVWKHNFKNVALPMLAGGSSWCCFSTTTTNQMMTHCETAMIQGVVDDNDSIAHIYQRALTVHNKGDDSSVQSWFSYLRRAIRMVFRAMKLACTLSPVIAFYPIQRMLLYQRDPTVDARDLALSVDNDRPVEGPLGWYLQLCLICVEWSGAAVIKLMQWAGSRPDMFGHDFCAVFSKLQDNTTPHAWRHTEKVLREAYGNDWKERIKIQKQDILGSGCIGQVYKGEVLDEDGKPMLVAVKGSSS